MKTRGLVLVAALAVPAASAWAQDEISYKTTDLGHGIYMLEGEGGFAGGNLGLLKGDDGVVLIDDGLEALSDKVLAAVTQAAGADVDFVLNTHVHGDHTGGNAALHGHGARIVAHDNIRKRMVASDTAGDALPEITFSKELSFHLNGQHARAIHVNNAHTDGDAIIHFPDANVIHTGDALFNGLFPYIDLGSGGSVDGFVDAQDRIIELADADTQIIPGHGPLATRADVVRARDMLADARSRIQALVDRGLSLEEVQAENPLADYHDGWNWSFITTERMTEQLYNGLSDNN